MTSRNLFISFYALAVTLVIVSAVLRNTLAHRTQLTASSAIQSESFMSHPDQMSKANYFQFLVEEGVHIHEVCFDRLRRSRRFCRLFCGFARLSLLFIHLGILLYHVDHIIHHQVHYLLRQIIMS